MSGAFRSDARAQHRGRGQQEIAHLQGELAPVKNIFHEGVGGNFLGSSRRGCGHCMSVHLGLMQEVAQEEGAAGSGAPSGRAGARRGQPS